MGENMNTQFVTVFKRLKPKKNNELPLKPVDIIFGEIKDTNGKKNFISSSGEKLKCGDDFESLNDTFVYGYPFNISEYIDYILVIVIILNFLILKIISFIVMVLY